MDKHSFSDTLLSDILQDLHSEPPMVPYLEKDLTLVIFSLLVQRHYPVSLIWKSFAFPKDDDYSDMPGDPEWFVALHAHGETLNYWNQAIFDVLKAQNLLWENIGGVISEQEQQLFIEKALSKHPKQIEIIQHYLDRRYLLQETPNLDQSQPYRRL